MHGRTSSLDIPRLSQVVMLFPRPFWPVDADMFGRVADTTAERGEFFLFYSYTHVCGRALSTNQPLSQSTTLGQAR